MKSLPLTNSILLFGTFDIIHAGHEDFFRQARALDSKAKLVVSVARDKNVKRIKGAATRHSEKQRLAQLLRHPLVDEAVLSGTTDYLSHIVAVAPKIIALGYDQTAYVNNLKADLSRAGLHPKIVRLKPFKAEEYKTARIVDSKGFVKLAIFDIDGTLFRSSLVRELTSILVSQKVFPKNALTEISDSYDAWLSRRDSYEKFINQIVTVFQKYIPGKTPAQLETASALLMEQQRDHVYRFTRDLVKDCKKKGYFLLAISGSPIMVVKPFADYFNFHAACGREYEIVNGTYTGVVPNHREMNLQKNIIVKHYLESHGLKADYKKSLAIGDTQTEIPLLKVVGNPIVFNPNMELAQYAKRRGLPVVLERKDVIFELSAYNFKKFLG